MRADHRGGLLSLRGQNQASVRKAMKAPGIDTAPPGASKVREGHGAEQWTLSAACRASVA
jgi:hypothetical protein